jgi:hypothetical protein
MKRIFAVVLACVTLGAVTISRPAAADAIVGVNTVDVAKMNPAQQSALLAELAAAHVTNLRLDLKPASVSFIIAAYHQGIGSIAILPFAGDPARARQVEPQAGFTWAQVPLSAPDVAVFSAKDTALLNQLDAAGIRLTALEFGNEINNPGFNGDFSAQGHGEVYGMAEIASPGTAETTAVRAGFLAYLGELKQVKQWRDASAVNKQTPLLSAGLADPGLPGTYPGRRLDGVSISGTLSFLRANGLDALIDGYAVHVYPSNNPDETLAQRAATLKADTFAACVPGGKPCWLTEWGFNNKSTACPLDDATRAGIVSTMRTILGQLVASGQLRAAIYYSWSGHLGVQNSPEAIYRCGALTQAGVLALEPF